MTKTELTSRLRNYVRNSAELIPGELAAMKSKRSVEEYNLTI
jgi:hypothetical protein